MMIDKSTIIKVTNRSGGSLGYTVPDMGIVRRYEHNETKEVTMEELRKLSNTNGGRYVIANCVTIHNEDAVNELLGNVEPEYFYDKDDIKTLLASGSLAQLEDCLNFAPDGVIDLVKKIAVEDELNDVAKRDLILKKTGFNVTSAIAINKETLTEEAAAPKTRKAAPITGDSTSEPTRKATPPKYKVVSK